MCSYLKEREKKSRENTEREGAEGETAFFCSVLHECYTMLHEFFSCNTCSGVRYYWIYGNFRFSCYTCYTKYVTFPLMRG